MNGTKVAARFCPTWYHLSETRVIRHLTEHAEQHEYSTMYKNFSRSGDKS